MLTVKELQHFPDDCIVYRAVGKAYVRDSMLGVLTDLTDGAKDVAKDIEAADAKEQHLRKESERAEQELTVSSSGPHAGHRDAPPPHPGRRDLPQSPSPAQVLLLPPICLQEFLRSNPSMAALFMKGS